MRLVYPIFLTFLFYNLYHSILVDESEYVQSFTDDRLADFVIYTTDSMPSTSGPAPSVGDATSTFCARYVGTAPPGVLPKIRCDDVMIRRYVVIQIQRSSGYLTLCEVEIYGKGLISSLLPFNKGISNS